VVEDDSGVEWWMMDRREMLQLSFTLACGRRYLLLLLASRDTLYHRRRGCRSGRLRCGRGNTQLPIFINSMLALLPWCCRSAPCTRPDELSAGAAGPPRSAEPGGGEAADGYAIRRRAVQRWWMDQPLAPSEPSATLIPDDASQLDLT
jgi:hypothetical protein